jgi:hypothetical protein
MRRSLYIKFVFVQALFFFVLAGCKDLYQPSVASTNAVNLVVEGFINSGPDSTVIRLTHSFKLEAASKISYELHAQVYVEDLAGDQYLLPELGQGQYGVPQLGLDPAKTYRLHIKTATGSDYASDYVPLKASPPIDSINWTVSGSGLQIYANTHDPQQSTHYYRWEYDEAWEFHAKYFAGLKYVNHQVLDMLDDTIYTCYQFGNSTNILLSSSARLANDVIYQAPMVFIPQMDWRLDDEYSILVKEYALTQDAYNYWSALEKNTEQLGTIFGPLPSDVRGNIHNLKDSSEEVIGYIGCGSIATKRIFITILDLTPYGWSQSTFGSECFSRAIPKDSADIYFGQGNYWPLTYTVPPSFGYIMAPSFCANCTLTGTNKRPSYWP